MWNGSSDKDLHIKPQSISVFSKEFQDNLRLFYQYEIFVEQVVMSVVYQNSEQVRSTIGDDFIDDIVGVLQPVYNISGKFPQFQVKKDQEFYFTSQNIESIKELDNLFTQAKLQDIVISDEFHRQVAQGVKKITDRALPQDESWKNFYNKSIEEPTEEF